MLRAMMLHTDFVNLLAAEQIEPRGERRADLRAARICAVMANRWRGKNESAMSIDDFMPKFGPTKRGDRRALALKLRAYTASVGGSVEDKKV